MSNTLQQSPLHEKNIAVQIVTMMRITALKSRSRMNAHRCCA